LLQPFSPQNKNLWLHRQQTDNLHTASMSTLQAASDSDTIGVAGRSTSGCAGPCRSSQHGRHGRRPSFGRVRHVHHVHPGRHQSTSCQSPPACWAPMGLQVPPTKTSLVRVTQQRLHAKRRRGYFFRRTSDSRRHWRRHFHDLPPPFKMPSLLLMQPTTVLVVW
jgi:hypothetical protein